MSNTETVQAIYGAFGHGDVPAILSHLAEDVQWEHWEGGNSGADAGIPYLQPRTGSADVAHFFEAVGGLEFHQFEPFAFIASDDNVAVRFHVDVTVKATGKRFRDDELHSWTFNSDGKVASFRHYIDTGKHIAAAQA